MTGFPSLDPQFDRFLYASLCQHDEMTVSVLSALTRQGIDPWQLAFQLSTVKGSGRKNARFDSGEVGSWKMDTSEANQAVVRLIELLPSQNTFGLASPSMESLKGHLLIWWLLVRYLVGNACFIRGKSAANGQELP